MKDIKRVNIGPVPPPIGGVTVYLSRLRDICHEVVIDSKHYTASKVLEIMLLFGCEIRLNDFRRSTLIVVCIKMSCIRLNCKLSLVNHNFNIINSIDTRTGLRGSLVKWLIAMSSTVYHVNSTLLNNFAHKYPRKMVALLDPFIPPTTQKCIDIREFYAHETVMFIESQQILIVAGAFRLSFHNGEDLYGFDMLIELIYYLKQKLEYKIGLLFGLADSASNQDYYHTCIARIHDLGLQDSIKVLENQQLLWPAISRADMLIRPTNTDGDPISIKEAVYFSVPVIASDCTVRHEKAILFKSRDQDSLNAVVHDCICEQCFLTRKLKAEA